MPDWSYRTIIRPILLRMNPERARRFAIGTLECVGRTVIGRAMIDFLGHMCADTRLARKAGGHSFPSPVGIGSLLDPEARALNAFGGFGCGFLEVGPVAEKTIAPTDWDVDFPQGKIVHRGPSPTLSVEDAVSRLKDRVHRDVPIFVRLAGVSVDAIRALAPFVAGLVIRPEDRSCIATVRANFPGILLVAISDAPVPLESEGADGVWICGSGKSPREAIASARANLADGIIVCGGVFSPADAREFLALGATLVCVDGGLAISGPGLVKRTNEALLSLFSKGECESLTLDAARMSWFWALMLGVAMLFGGGVAVALASSRVILPYDEALCGIPRGAFASINPRLLPFMAHDRMTLAGTMLSIGILYSSIAWNGIRRGLHWAKTGIVLSSGAGFFSFFLFLGFEYFDPFHAFITAVLVQFVFLTLFAPLGSAQPNAGADWVETPEWRRAQWGQLLFIAMGIGLITAGLVIAYVGCTSVLVGTDLEFLRITAMNALVGTDRLIPLIAHDRASLGGMLIANGIIIWLGAQWGMRAGTGWLWRALAWGGNIAFATAVGIHLFVGYTSGMHLTPALAAWGVWLAALALTRGWMCGKSTALNPRTQTRWYSR